MSLVEADDLASDDALVAAAKRGDTSAFAHLYRRYRADIRMLCSRSVSDPHLTEDITQETFLRAFRHIGEFERGRPLWPWLATIAKRLCIDELRGTSRRDALGRSVAHATEGRYDATSEEALARVERQRLNRVISRAVAALRPRDRKVFVLQSIEGWTHEQIAEQHGMSVHAVRNLAWRAKRSLRRSLGSERAQNWGLVLAFRTASARGRARMSKRWRVRTWMDGHLDGAVLERAATVVLSLAAASATVFGGGAIHGGTSDPTGSGFIRAVPIRHEGSAPIASSPNSDRHDGAGGRGSPPSIVGASVSFAGAREGAAAPSGAKGHIEVRDQNGRTLAWYDHDMNCGGQGSTLIPRSSPINVVC